MMQKMIMDIDAYLERIGLIEQPDVSVAGLFALQRAHMLYVPFENLDVFLRRPLSLALPNLFDKVITRKRGGYCFELNTLYAELLRIIGFTVRPLFARVWLREAIDVPARAHIIHLVDIEGQCYITDVGFGGRTSLVPLDIDSSKPVEDGDGLIRVLPIDLHGYMVQRFLDGKWQAQFSFTTEHVYKADIEMANHFMETHETSHFRHARYVGMFTKLGRDGLADNALTIRIGDALNVQTVPLGEEWEACIYNHFGLVLGLTSDERDNMYRPRESEV